MSSSAAVCACAGWIQIVAAMSSISENVRTIRAMPTPGSGSRAHGRCIAPGHRERGTGVSRPSESDFTVIVMKRSLDSSGRACSETCFELLSDRIESIRSIVMANCYCQEKVFYRTCQLVVRLLELVVIATIVGCSAPERHAQALARSHELESLLLQGSVFQHRAFAA